METQPDIPVPPTVSQDDSYDRYFNYSTHLKCLRRIVTDWDSEIDETEKRRKIRKLELDVEALRKSGEIGLDETFIPLRIIDTNIQREQPSYINYLKNSRRLALFRNIDNDSADTQKLEDAFTDGMTYEGWETAHYKCLDGAQTHGWDCVEVVYDESKPLHVGIEHVGHDKLFFARTTESFADCPRVIRQYDVTRERLRQFVDRFGFSATVVDSILEVSKDTANEDDTVKIYKVSFKVDGIVHVAWFSLDTKANEWLKPPVKLYVGIDRQVTKTVPTLTGQFDLVGNPIVTQQEVTEWVPAPVTKLPYFLLPYRESEQPQIFEHEGRVYYDENKQEASSSIMSAFVNTLNRAQKVYGSPKTEDGSGGKLKELNDVTLADRTILNKPFEFWNFPYPDPIVLNALKFFDVQNAQETNQVAFAVNNREDSRKTAKEIASAEQQQALLNSVQLVLFSTYIRSVYSFVWLIVQSQALQNRIKFLQVETQQPQLNPLDGTPLPDPMTGQPLMETVMVNDAATIAARYDVRAAGDVDVVQRQEKLMQMKQDWPVIAQTPARFEFLADMLKLQYPDGGDKYSRLVLQAPVIEQMQGQVMALSTVLQGMLKQYPEIAQQLPPQQLQQLQQIMASLPQSPNEPGQNIQSGSRPR